MRLVSWNVQWCRGLDGMVDPGRIASELRRIADPDVACLQEVAAGFADLPGSTGEDQAAALAAELGDHPVTGWGVDVAGVAGVRKRFGNMILTRLPVGRVRCHALPWPASRKPSMPRVAVEAIVQAPFGPVRVVSTHLEYYSATQRKAQVARLAELYHAEWTAERTPVQEPGPFQSQAYPKSTILCGDFNLPPHDPLHRALLEIGFVDAWQHLNGGTPHPHTFRVHERDDGEAPYCCDFVFVTPDLAPRLASIRVDRENRASDHQPVIVELR